ncbi:uncharacterized protein TRIADDRAFT_57222 [Trichoplax adhaerens]|uniref:DNA polymerase alpha subunit B n=1 Tax=Trichoplax adhaerens TaxID=10228 RepID=B3RYU8_TRIAD|nr:hypothetical protein TRIADDRAFT_57222 [Trichoplax adhaerens]EDV23732.1 hypothetical protein TRIADDRAFT_57222 [Trichoplax adhaerens]|eukprot:XP_002113258.1 hypothetical protein TRIADDRAFT_57222 [Trichoplax adhaerens]
MVPPADQTMAKETVLATKLVAEFESFGVIIDDLGIIDNLRAMCKLYSLDESTMVDEWMAFACSSGNDIEITHSALESFEKELSAYRLSILASRLDREEHSLIDAYCTPEMKASKRLLKTPESDSRKLIKTPYKRTPASQIFSPNSYSPNMYSSRGNAGEILATLNMCGINDETINWKGHGIKTNVTAADPDQCLDEGYRYMFQKISERIEALRHQVSLVAEPLQEQHGIQELGYVDVPSQDGTTVIGRIGCDSNGRLNAASLVIAGYNPNRVCRSATPLNVKELSHFSFFPGQVVVLDGKNPSGNAFIASKLYQGIALPFNKIPLEKAKSYYPSDDSPMNILVACGPFTTADNLLYEPLSDLLKVILNQQPDIAILCGPFVDAKQELIKQGEINISYEDLFIKRLSEIIENVGRISTSVVFVPSTRDVHHDFIYPQPPFTLPSSLKTAPEIHFVSDPCTLIVNDVTIGLTSTDILFHMGAEETASPPGMSDRIGRLLKHLIHQRNYYPLYPPSEEVNFDRENFVNFGFMPVTPDILIVPSDLRYFVKDVEKCCCVNPGRLAKGQVGGSYARIAVLPPKVANQPVIDRIVSQVVRI